MKKWQKELLQWVNTQERKYILDVEDVAIILSINEEKNVQSVDTQIQKWENIIGLKGKCYKNINKKTCINRIYKTEKYVNNLFLHLQIIALPLLFRFIY